MRKTYGKGDTEVRALNGVDLQVESGEFAAVVGTPGSGKSTLLHMLGAKIQLTYLVSDLSAFEYVMEGMFWFFTPSFPIAPVLLVLPVFCLLGWSIPVILYRHTVRQGVVQRLRSSEL